MESPDINTVENVHRLFIEHGLSLALAESCTGGLIASAITSIEGASRFLDSSVVCYSAGAKQRLLGITGEFFKEHGTVGEDTTLAMAEAALKMSGCDVALAVTCVAGRDAVGSQEAGAAFVSVVHNGGSVSRRFKFGGSRRDVLQQVVDAALELLTEVVAAWR